MTQPTYDARAVVRAIDALTTQVKRVADATATPVADGDDGPATPVVTVHGDPDMSSAAREALGALVGVATRQMTEAPPAVGAPLPACRIMETRTCPPSYNGPCGDRPCARFESDDPAPWQDGTTAPAADEDALRLLRREGLLVLLTRLQRGRTLTEDEAATLRHHVETEIREANTAREVARGNRAHVQHIVPEIDRLTAELERANAVTAETKKLLERRTKTLRRRAQIAERELFVLRSGLRANGADPTQIQNLWAQIRLRNQQWRDTKRELAKAQAAIERVRALHTAHSFPNPDAPGEITFCLGCEDATSAHPCNTLAALDATAQ
ncbi:hypothetical protein ACGFZR_24675 [Streptomyces sp. NPDC048241]|uniref:hypothetical protein n=1 Tax=Streptomyces sp. NPDC048241 TaxID=3365521 RepID=UPI00371FC6DB